MASQPEYVSPGAPNCQLVFTLLEPGESNVNVLIGPEALSLRRNLYETRPASPTAEILPENRIVTGQGPV
jgi:hypothetical protein